MTLAKIIKSLELIASKNPNAQLVSDEIAIDNKGLSLSNEEQLALKKAGWYYSAIENAWYVETWR